MTAPPNFDGSIISISSVTLFATKRNNYVARACLTCRNSQLAIIARWSRNELDQQRMEVVMKSNGRRPRRTSHHGSIQDQIGVLEQIDQPQHSAGKRCLLDPFLTAGDAALGFCAAGHLRLIEKADR